MTGDRSFHNTVVRIADMTVRQPLIDGYTFVNCTLIGPAVLAFLHDVEMSHCTFEAEPNAIFWEIDPEQRPIVFGAVGVANTTFSSCTFQAIGLAGPAELREQLERAFSS